MRMHVPLSGEVRYLHNVRGQFLLEAPILGHQLHIFVLELSCLSLHHVKFGGEGIEIYICVQRA